MKIVKTITDLKTLAHMRFMEGRRWLYIVNLGVLYEYVITKEGRAELEYFTITAA